MRGAAGTQIMQQRSHPKPEDSKPRRATDRETTSEANLPATSLDCNDMHTGLVGIGERKRKRAREERREVMMMLQMLLYL